MKGFSLDVSHLAYVLFMVSEPEQQWCCRGSSCQTMVSKKEEKKQYVGEIILPHGFSTAGWRCTRRQLVQWNGVRRRSGQETPLPRGFLLNASPQTRCSSPWPAWPSTPATSSCRSTSWPSCTTSRWSSDGLRPAGPVWLSARWWAGLAGLVVLWAPRRGSIWSTWRQIFSQTQGHMGQSWSLPPFVQQRLECFWPMRTLRWRWRRRWVCFAPVFMSPSATHTSLLRTCMNCVDIHVWPQSRTYFNIFSHLKDDATVEMSWLYRILHWRWFLRDNFRLSLEAILSLPKICAAVNSSWH